MVTQTPRFDLNKYSQGEDNWSHSDTIDFVDEYSIDKGPVADRPTTGDYDDQLYFATDQGLFWRWDSNVSDWTTDAFGTESNRVPDTSYFDGVDANSVNTANLLLSGFEEVELDGSATGVSTPFTYTINDTSADVYIVEVVGAGSGGGTRCQVRFNGISTTDYIWVNPFGSTTTGDDRINTGGVGNSARGFSVRFMVEDRPNENGIGLSVLRGYMRVDEFVPVSQGGSLGAGGYPTDGLTEINFPADFSGTDIYVLRANRGVSQ